MNFLRLKKILIIITNYKSDENDRIVSYKIEIVLVKELKYKFFKIFIKNY